MQGGASATAVHPDTEIGNFLAAYNSDDETAYSGQQPGQARAASHPVPCLCPHVPGVGLQST